jgi:diguanylate cyclase (GGDEF)-like protein/PAS domain S-box-containing protein
MEHGHRLPAAVVAGTAVTGVVGGAAALGALTGSPWAVLLAVPAGGVAALARRRVARDAGELDRVGQLIDRAAEISRLATTRSSNRWSSAPVPRLEPADAGPPTPDRPGRHRSDDLAAGITGTVNSLLTALETEHSYRTLIETTGDLVLLVDELGQITLASTSATDVLGTEPAALVGRTLAGLVHASELEQLLDVLEDFDRRPAAERRSDRPRLRMKAADGGWRVLEWTLARWPGDPRAVLLTGRDVSEQVELAEQLRRGQEEDPLTRLPNRAAVIARVGELLAASTPQRPVAVLLMDLDGFTEINDSLGHAYGDALLVLAGQRLSDGVRAPDRLGRVGADEFAVVAAVEGVDGAGRLAQRLHERLAVPFEVDGVEIGLRASTGMALSHRPDRPVPPDAATLLTEAATALHRARADRSTVAVFEGGRDRPAGARLGDSARLRSAIAGGELEIHYQPVIDIAAARVDGVEALVRWQHPDRGLLPPAEFLPLAEETGLVVQLSRAVLDQVLAQARAWLVAGWDLPVSVNLSPNWLHQADVATEVHDALREHQVPAELLRMELTDGTAMIDQDVAAARLAALKELGVALSLDDFGAGHSSIAHLRRLPVDQIKVDRSYVQGMALSEADAAIVRATVGLGRSLGMTVVAEGVEDTNTLARVVGAGATLAQGFYFTRPLTAEGVTGWIRRRFPETAAVVG